MKQKKVMIYEGPCETRTRNNPSKWGGWRIEEPDSGYVRQALLSVEKLRLTYGSYQEEWRQATR